MIAQMEEWWIRIICKGDDMGSRHQHASPSVPTILRGGVMGTWGFHKPYASGSNPDYATEVAQLQKSIMHLRGRWVL